MELLLWIVFGNIMFWLGFYLGESDNKDEKYPENYD